MLLIIILHERGRTKQKRGVWREVTSDPKRPIQRDFARSQIGIMQTARSGTSRPW